MALCLKRTKTLNTSKFNALVFLRNKVPQKNCMTATMAFYYIRPDMSHNSLKISSLSLKLIKLHIFKIMYLFAFFNVILINGVSCLRT